MKGSNLAFVGGSVTVAIMAVFVFIGANAGECPRNKRAAATSVEVHHKADDKAYVEV